MINATPEELQEASIDAFDRVQESSEPEWKKKRWQNAIARAWKELQSNPYLEWQDEALLILSESNKIYQSNGKCQCKAYEKGFPCWHRAAARIVQRVLTSH
jgi:predicted nucleotidyltransferase